MRPERIGHSDPAGRQRITGPVVLLCMHHHPDEGGKGLAIATSAKAGKLTASSLSDRLSKSAGCRLKVQIQLAVDLAPRLQCRTLLVDTFSPFSRTARESMFMFAMFAYIAIWQGS